MVPHGLHEGLSDGIRLGDLADALSQEVAVLLFDQSAPKVNRIREADDHDVARVRKLSAQQDALDPPSDIPERLAVFPSGQGIAHHP